MASALLNSPRETVKSQKVSYFSNALIMHIVDFPIYYIESLSERHFLVAGGGGSSKTGVHNQINILELVQSSYSCVASLSMKYNTPEDIPDAIMSASLMRDLPIVDTRLLTGGSQLTMYSICYDHSRKSFSITDHETFEHSLPNAELKTLKYSAGKILTGTTDGHLAVWDASDKKIIDKAKIYDGEVDEIDVDADIGQVVTMSRSRAKCTVWRLDNLAKIREFDKEFINSHEIAVPSTKVSKFAFRSCKYGPDPSTKYSKSGDKRSFLYIACNSIPSNGSSKLYKISAHKLGEFKFKAIPVDGIMAMKVSQDGRYLGIGSRLGCVEIYDTLSLIRIYAINAAHHNAVTNLEFLEPKPEMLSLTNSQTCALLSVSIDRRIVLHRPKKVSTTRNFLQIMTAALVIYFIVVNIFRYLS